MKNIIVLYYPPFRNTLFPIHFMQSMQGYNFFLLVTEGDLPQHKKLAECNYIKDAFAVNFNIDNLIIVCDTIKKKYGDIHNILYIDENCAQVCGDLCKHYNFSSDNLDRFTNKWLMSEKLRKTDVRIPKSALFDDIRYLNYDVEYLLEIENILGEYPYFIKPHNLSGSRNTYFIKDRNTLMKWAQQKNSLNYVIQEYMDGKLFHCESFVKNYEILDSFVFEYSRPGFFFSKGQSVGSISLPDNHSLNKRISNFTRDVLQELGPIKNGITHVEVYLDRNDELIFLEAAARPPGLVGNLLYKKYLNISINEIHLLLQLEECHQNLRDIKVNNYAARCIFPFTKTGRITKITDKPHINSAFFENFTFNVGDEVKKSDDFFNVAGTMILWNKDYTELRKDFLALSDYNPFEIEADKTSTSSSYQDS